MDNRAKLDEGLVLDPTIGVVQAPLEELNALSDPLDIVMAQVLHEAGEVLDADLADAPDLIIVELLECALVHFFYENLLLEVLRDRDQRRHHELLDLEEHAILDVL